MGKPKKLDGGRIANDTPAVKRMEKKAARKHLRKQMKNVDLTPKREYGGWST